MTKEPRDPLQFYLTAPSPCPYLAGRTERKVFTHLVGMRAREVNEALSQHGFRRSQTIAYRPACDGCRSCVPVRVVVEEFARSAGFRRVAKRNADLSFGLEPTVATREHYSLFRAYLDARHPDGGMADMSFLDFGMMVEDSHVDTALACWRGRDDGRLHAACLIDRLSDGLSMVYSYFRPQETARSLGVNAILDVIDMAGGERLPYVHLGYWVEGSQKMAYKSRFLPQERLTRDGWRRYDAAEPT
ncbi:MAG: arginyltransferase [Hyphomicrobiales bacterium]|nr:arginyltransferase [Hyphomicrobiales bacterium]MDE2016767.1 arginyltransferase [Hyphomicrobiales bacterium]